MFIDHDHTHQWERLGVHSEREWVYVVYQCKDCSAWSKRMLKPGAEQEFRTGQVAEVSEDG